MDKSRIDGAYLLLKRFKLRLKQFDKALEKLHSEKASTEQFSILCQSLDRHRATAIFNDMKNLFDNSIKSVQSNMKREREKTEDMHIVELQHKQTELRQIEMKYSYLYNEKLGKLQGVVDGLALEHSNVAEKVETMDILFAEGLKRQEKEEILKKHLAPPNVVVQEDENKLKYGACDVQTMRSRNRFPSGNDDYEMGYGHTLTLGEETVSKTLEAAPDNTSLYQNSNIEQQQQLPDGSNNGPNTY